MSLASIISYIGTFIAGAGAMFVVNITVLNVGHDEVADMIRNDRAARMEAARRDYEARQAQIGGKTLLDRSNALHWGR